MKLYGIEKRMGSFSLSVDGLELCPGKIHGLIGPNGAGKSILLKIMMGLIKPDSGYVDYEGVDLRKVTMMTQQPYLLHKSVYENLLYPLKIRGIRPDPKELDRLLERAGMLHHRDQYALSLSSGERQKLSFLRAVVFEPDIILMDETLSNLDPESEKTIVDMIMEIQRERRATWVIVSHQLEGRRGLCDRIHRMEAGRITG